MTLQQKLQHKQETNNFVTNSLGYPEEFFNTYKLIMKKILNIHNSLGSLVIMEYNGKVNNIFRGVKHICYRLKTYRNNTKQEI